MTQDKLRRVFPDNTEIVTYYSWALVLYHAQQYRRAMGETAIIQVQPEMLWEICSQISNFTDGSRKT